MVYLKKAFIFLRGKGDAFENGRPIMEKRIVKLYACLLYTSLWHIFLRDTAAHSICIAEHLRYRGNGLESVGERLFAGCVPPGNHTDDLVGTAKFLVDADGVRADLSGGIHVYLAGAISKVDPVFGDKGRQMCIRDRYSTDQIQMQP